MIIVKTVPADPLSFDVTVREKNGETHHKVSMSMESLDRLAAGRHAPEKVIEAAFEFLLEREPKESILGEFDVKIISHYFPDFESRIGDYFR